MKRSTRIYRAIVETLENRRLLSYSAPVSYTVGADPQSVATGDFNGDSRSDVVTANAVSSNVSVLLSNANGTLQPAQTFATGTNPRSLAVGDVNNDGKRDIITANTGGGNLSVLLGNGNGTFQAALTVTLPTQVPPGYTGTTPLTQYPTSVAVGDLNADGKLDLAVNGRTTHYVPYVSPYGGYWPFPQSNGYVNVLVGNGNGTFASANPYLANSVSNFIALADMSNDNKLDVVTGYPDPAVWLGNGNGTLQQPPARFSPAYSNLAVGDFDMDGKRDLISGGGLNFLKGQGNGTFQNPVAIPVMGEVRSVVAGDVNGDGKLDLVANTSQTTFASYGYYGGYDPTTTVYTKVLLGSGNGTFSRGVSSTVTSYAGYASSFTSALGDFNADGRPDVVMTDPLQTRIFVQLNEPGWIVPGTLTINHAATVTEGNTGTVNAVFTVTLAEAPAANVSVDYAVTDGTATLASGDFVANSGTLIFTPGQTSKTITVQVKGDRVGELDEDFSVNLTNSINADIIHAHGYGTIDDDEPYVWIEAGPTVTEGNSGTVPITFTATLSATSDAPVVLSYTTVDGTATGATDYVPVTSTITFAPGQTSKTFTTAVKGDLVPEPGEYFYVNLTGASNALMVNNQTTGSILDTDPDPTISIANMTRSEGNSGTETVFEFILSVSKPSEKMITVLVSTSSGTATSSGSNRDFYAASSYITIYPNQTSVGFGITVLGDNRSESDETFSVNLSDPAGATIADNQGVGTILNDETRGKKWIGPATGGNWSTASNWSPSGVPVSTSLVKIDGASVTASASVNVDELSLVNYATLTVAPGGGKVVRTRGLFMDYQYSTLNLNDNSLIVDYTTAAGISPLGGWNFYNYSGVTAMVGYGSHPTWQAGITTTRPDALAGLTTLGIGEASQILGLTGSQNGLFSGQTVDATTILVKYTYRGDANLDGTLDIDDYTAIDSGISAGLNGWSNGDFNYDGKLNIDDYVILDSNLRTQGAPFASPAMGSSGLRFFSSKRDALGANDLTKRNQPIIELLA